ncbi:hypothetical protein GGI35DRAFT_474783 [Trichoderma velutinum]
MSATDNSSRYPVTIFSTLNNLFEELETETRQGLVVEYVDRRAYANICAERAERCRRYRFTLYLARREILIITMPNPHHDALSQHLESVIARQVNAMGLGEDWRYEGSTTYLDRSNGNLHSAGEGNLVGRPRLVRFSIHDWPTIAVECGPPNSMPLLQEKAVWWFRSSRGDVNVVLLFEVDTFARVITIEKWEVVPRREGRSFRASPGCVQTVVIRQLFDVSGTFPIVFNGPLWLDFATLFLRLPRENSDEGPVFIDDNELANLAQATWSAEDGVGEA